MIMHLQPTRHLILALAVALAPLLFKLPWWAILWCLAFWGMALNRNSNRLPMPSRAVRAIFFSSGLILVVASAGLRFDGDDFIVLLAVMAGIKPLEVHCRRDCMVTVFLAYFLVIASLFVFETLSMTVYLFVSVWVSTAALIHVNNPVGAFGPQVRLAARLVLWAVPATMLLFLLFPRLPGSFIGAPWARQNYSGFTDVIRMGDISRLVVNDTPVFSVSFNDSPPGASQRYWRGIVFHSFDGDTWKPGSRLSRRRETVQANRFVHYKVILEPHGHRNLFVLDLPVTSTAAAALMEDNTLMAWRPVRQRLTYEATSTPGYRSGQKQRPREHCLQLPSNRNPKTLALGRQLAHDHDDPAAVVGAGLDFLKDNEFTYSLRPDHLGKQAVDDFLFTTRNGFCEHFAGAFTVLMRSAGIPTRMVGGYLGGRWNAWGDFLIVRQADAHVWCEVWLEEKGWVRVDPTVEVAPRRMEEGIDGLFDNLPWLAGRSLNPVLGRWIEAVHQSWEAVNLRWDLWFMSFSAEEQTDLLKNIGRQGTWLLSIGAVLGVWGSVFFVFQWKRNRRPKTTAQKAQVVFNRFVKKMSRVGLDRPSHQGAWDYSRTVIRQYPSMEKEVGEIVERYQTLRYGPRPEDGSLKLLRILVRTFNPRGSVRGEQ